MLNPYPTSLRPRSNSNPIRPYTLLRQKQLEKQKFEAKVASPEVAKLPPESGLPPRPPRNPARLTTTASLITRPSDDIDTRDSRSDWEVLPSSLASPITVLSDIPNSPPSRSNKQSPATSPTPRFSTLDRTILRELKRSMLARSAQFRLKNNKKHHPFRPDQVPYPRSYENICVDCDVWESVFCKQFSGSVTWHVFDQLPTKVLDLGCGTGSWIVDCARKWKHSHFVGLDIVPLHPDLGYSELGNRITWVQANFLEPLPFPNEEFDFVHIKRIARGVPEDKWDFLFEEITRVMKPGGAFEMLEEDLYLPGRLRETRSSTPSSSATTSDSTSSISDTGTQLTSASSSPSGPSVSKSRSFSVGRGGSGNIKRSRAHGKAGIEFHPHSARSKSRVVSTGRGGSGNIRFQPKPRADEAAPHARTSGRVDRITLSGSQLSFDQFSIERSVSEGSLRRSSSTEIPNQLLSPHFSLQSLVSEPALGSNSRTKRIRTSSPPSPNSAEFAYPASYLSLLSATQSRPKNSRPSSSGGRMSGPSPESPILSKVSSRSSLKSSFTVTPTGAVQPISKVALANQSNTDVASIKSGKGKGREREIVHEVLLDGAGRKGRSRSLSYSIEGNQAQGKRKPSHDDPKSNQSYEQSENARLIALLGALETSPSYSLFTGGHCYYPAAASSPFTPSSKTLVRPPNLLISPPQGKQSRSHSRLTLPLNMTSGSGSDSNAPRHHTSAHVQPMNSNHASTYSSTPGNPRDHRLLEIIYAEMHSSRFVNLEPLSLLENYLGLYFKDVRTHAPLIFTFPPLLNASASLDIITVAEVDEVDLDRIHDAAYDHDRASIVSARFSVDEEHSDSHSPSSSPSRSGEPIPSHVSDTNSLTNSQGYPRSVGEPLSEVEHSWIFTSPSKKSLPTKLGRSTNGPRRNFVSARELMSGTSEYVIVDRSRMSAFGPRGPMVTVRKANGPPENNDKIGEAASVEGLPSFSATDMDDIRVRVYPEVAQSNSDLQGHFHSRTVEQVNKLPNKNIDMDLRTLNLHLHARVAEVLACAESMWEWVKEFQRREKEKERGRMKSRAGASTNKRGVNKKGSNTGKPNLEGDFGLGMDDASLSAMHSPVADGVGERLGQDVKGELLQMNRERFDEIMTWFQFDMEDSVTLGAAVHSHFGWNSFVPQRTDGRTAFDMACSRWDAFEANRLHTHVDGGENGWRAEVAMNSEGDKEGRTRSSIPPSKRLCRTLRVFVAWKA